jgi:hypothetical protein
MNTITEKATEIRALAKWTREKAEAFARSLAEEHGHNPSMWPAADRKHLADMDDRAANHDKQASHLDSIKAA